MIMSAGASRLEPILRQEGINVIRGSHKPSSAADARELETVARSRGATWVVVDGYHFGPEYHQSIMAQGLKLLVIDDNGQLGRYDADLVLNQNPSISEKFYTNRGANTRLLLGSDYALLRREFLSYRDPPLDRSRPPHHLLVTLGGSDPDNVTMSVLNSLTMCTNLGLQTRIVVGVMNPHRQALLNALPPGDDMQLVDGTGHMPELMAWADIAITAGGSTCWELAFMGLPCIILVIAANQDGNAVQLAKREVAVNLGTDPAEDRIASALQSLAGDPERCLTMGRNGRHLVDGLGSARVAAELAK